MGTSRRQDRGLMSKEPDRRATAGPVISGARQDFTYKQLAGLRLTNANFRQSLFIGAVLQDCCFVGVNFDRCDFAGAKIVNCKFERCRFIPDEFRSCVIRNSQFTNCTFKGSQWIRIELAASRFEGCDFRESSIRECRISLCQLDGWKLKRSSVTLSHFSGCDFRNVDLGDCTAQFLFFDECHFSECRINAESIGYTYGLSQANVDALKLIYLGRNQKKPSGLNLVELL